MIRLRNANTNTATPQLSIVVPTPLYGGSLPIAYHAAEAFEQLGHNCHTIKFDEQYDTYNLLSRDVVEVEGRKLQGRYAELLADFAVEQALALSADLVWYTAQSPVSINGLRRLRANGVKCALWFVEDVRRFEYWKYMVPEYDVVFTIQQGAAADAMRQAGARNVIYLPCAANPRVHRPLTLTDAARNRYGASVSFVGAGYPNRVRLFEDTNIPDLKLWGNDWPKDWSSRLQDSGRRVSPEETAMIYNATAVNLNIHSAVSGSVLEYGDFVNPRTFEIAACGGFQIINDQMPLSDLFTKEELAVVSNESELFQSVSYYHARPDLREKMSKAAQSRVLREHTYTHRMSAALAQIYATPQQASKKTARPTFADLKTAAWGNEDMQAFLSQFNDAEPATLAKLYERVGSDRRNLSRAELTIMLMQEFRNWGVEKGVIQ